MYGLRMMYYDLLKHSVQQNLICDFFFEFWGPK